MKTYTRIWKLVRENLINSGRKFIFPFAILLFLGTNSYAQSAVIRIQPDDITVATGGSFSVTVKAELSGGQQLDAVAIELDFIASQLNVTSVTNLSATALPDLITGPTFNNSTGRVSFFAGRGAQNPPGYVDQTFDVLTINFTVLPGAATGNSPLTLRRTSSPFTRAIRSGVDVTSSVVNGIVHINATSCAASATISNTISCDGQPFNLVLQTTNNAAHSYDLTINGNNYFNRTEGNVITQINPTQNIFNTPPLASNITDASVTLGVKFKASANGKVKGVRFFSHNSPSGTYTGFLWTESGTYLTSATFINVTGSAWQQVLFATPISITADQVYVAGYHTTSGLYAFQANTFSSEVNNGQHLTVLQNGGVFRYGGASFPDQAQTTSNYWADVIFTPDIYTLNLTYVKDINDNCSNSGSLQTLNVSTTSQCGSLPITLLNFSATPQNKNIILKWTTSTEINNKGFEIQRSQDNIIWEKIGFVNGAGNSTSTKNYSFADNNLFPRRYYYRLKQIDLDENYKFSSIVSATIDGKGEFSLSQNFPNPFKGQTTIQFTLPQISNVNLTVFDLNGKIVKVLVNGVREAGTYAENLYTGQLPAGIYYYKIQAGDFSSVKKLVVQ